MPGIFFFNGDKNLHLELLYLYQGIKSTGYTLCEPRGHPVSDIASRCAHGAICARSLECEHSDSASLDYVASGSTNRAVKDRILDGPPKKEITKTDTPKGSILVILGGACLTKVEPLIRFI